MTAKEFVQDKYPNAKSERQISGRNEVYYLIRDGRNTMYMAHGKNESNAWVNAKKRIIENNSK